MNFDEAMDAVVSRDEARKEIELHQVEGGWTAFVEEIGDKPEYSGAEVLAWLGY